MSKTRDTFLVTNLCFHDLFEMFVNRIGYTAVFDLWPEVLKKIRIFKNLELYFIFTKSEDIIFSAFHLIILHGWWKL